MDGEIGLQAALYLTDEQFVQRRIKESLGEEVVSNKKRAVEIAEKQVGQLEKEKRRVAEAIRKAPDIDVLLKQLDDVGRELSEAKERLQRANEELSVCLTDKK